MKRLLLGLLLVLPFAAEAAGPGQSLRPQVRPETLLRDPMPKPVTTQDLARPAAPRPQAPETLGVTADVPTPPPGVEIALRPRARPQEVVQTARVVTAQRARGAVCGDPALQGVVVGRVPAEVSGCGIDNAVRISSVGGVALSTHALMDCGTARALKSWVEGGLEPAVGSYGGGVRSLRVVAHYACRPRNNRKGAKISEHGKGRAIDIAAIRLVDGKDLVVLNDWGGGRKGRILRQAHAAACGPFGTVLGPEANALHRDHFHFDTARYRSGSYCR